MHLAKGQGIKGSSNLNEVKQQIRTAAEVAKKIGVSEKYISLIGSLQSLAVPYLSVRHFIMCVMFDIFIEYLCNFQYSNL